MNKEKRSILLWLIPLILFLLLAVPTGIQFFNNIQKDDKTSEKQENKEPDKKDKEQKDKEDKKGTDQDKDEEKVEKPEPKPVMEEYGQPYLELTESVVKVPQGSEIDYQKYIKTAENGDKSNATLNVSWQRIDTKKDVGTLQVITYILKDELTEERVAQTLLVEITEPSA